MAEVISAADYYAFGSLMPMRNASTDDYRYGFNGMEKDDEVKGTGNSLDFGARIYDPRVGRWLSLDPLMAKYLGMSPYNFVGNSPIKFVDYDGKDFGVVVDHDAGTVIIVANVYALKDDVERAQNAANTWAEVNGGMEYTYTDEFGKKQTYSISVKISVIESVNPEGDAMADPEGNSFRVLDGTPEQMDTFFSDDNNPNAEVEGVTKGKKLAYVKKDGDSRDDAHEMGHFLMSGTKMTKNTHSLTKGDLMYPAKKGGGYNIGKSTIQRILKGAGIGGINSPSINTNATPQNSVTHMKGGKKVDAPKGFNNGKVQIAPKKKAKPVEKT
ncbi:RHS repeat-associated core domain-containing protein [bacterium SCSIO 12643]|nr:RHS repeat-associated core domain-containing protein [bacterium SCSIO 12643]